MLQGLKVTYKKPMSIHFDGFFYESRLIAISGFYEIYVLSIVVTLLVLQRWVW
jgi:hypothetical protein